MPLYDYTCHDCRQDFETQISFSDLGRVVRCPLGHENTVRLFTFASYLLARGRNGSNPEPAPEPVPEPPPAPPAAPPNPYIRSSGSICGGMSNVG
ncbi:FmdB family zinc ribbon protein [Streptomyces sp. NPDC085866]|uniref:FmdB family zinc ribbon protein n=1 Tax=Streptomyces sp. NPDC085866 TaxID=3365736 RepID=UPI0037D890D3